MQTAPAGRQFMQGGTDMEKNITIRPERVSDYQQVEDIIRQAFYNLYSSTRRSTPSSRPRRPFWTPYGRRGDAKWH